MKTINIPVEFKRLFDDNWREAAVYGGRFSLKSHTVARFLLIRARERKTRVACFREFQSSIAESSHQLLADLINLYGLKDFEVTNNSIINKYNGSDFIFKGLYLNEQSIKSIEGIDLAWVEEAQTVSKKSLEILTPTIRKEKSKIIYTYNRLLEDDPVHQRLIIEGRPDTLIINVNYDIAIKYGMMPDVVRKEMEDDKEKRPALYKHKWLGEPNTMEKKIYKGWQVIKEIPHEARLERYGLNFGYSNHPLGLIALYYYNGGYIIDEILYGLGIQNRETADTLKNLPRALVVADSAEPKSIDEIKAYGINIIGVKKVVGRVMGSLDMGTDNSFVKWSIGIVQQEKISYTERSFNVDREYRNYFWKTDNNDRIINEPEEPFHFIMDACRYPIVSLAPVINRRELINQIPIIKSGPESNPAR
jgi:PBSX family phage terminase large subunit